MRSVSQAGSLVQRWWEKGLLAHGFTLRAGLKQRCRRLTAVEQKSAHADISLRRFSIAVRACRRPLAICRQRAPARPHAPAPGSCCLKSPVPKRTSEAVNGEVVASHAPQRHQHRHVRKREQCDVVFREGSQDFQGGGAQRYLVLSAPTSSARPVLSTVYIIEVDFRPLRADNLSGPRRGQDRELKSAGRGARASRSSAMNAPISAHGKAA